ncbi:MAG: hypothetical protein M0Z51_16775 [Propionibacterium sp.]|nr:hypothetical protein [Propionibacterium sp.]
MRVVSADLDAEVAGSSQGDALVVSAWRGGDLLAANLLVSAWSLSWDVSRQVQGQATLTIVDPDGTLAPWGMSDPLGPGGSRLSLAWVSGTTGIRVPLGMWRIRKAKPAEAWLVYGTQGPTTWLDAWTSAWSDTWGVPVQSRGTVRVSGGASVQVQADEDVTATASLCRLDGETVTAGATSYAEIVRLLQEIGAVDTTAAPAAVMIQPSYQAYPEDRMSAVSDLLDMAYATYRVGPDGSLQVVPVAGVGPVWTIQGGETGALVQLDRELSDAGTYNAATSRGTDSSGGALVGRAYLGAGPLAWGGPYGKVAMFHQAIGTTQAAVDADAATLLANQVTAGTVDLAVTCLAHPGVQPHDLVTVVAPTAVGDLPLVGRVVAMSWSSAQSDAGVTPGKAMVLTVRVSADDLAAVAAQVARG